MSHSSPTQAGPTPEFLLISPDEEEKVSSGVFPTVTVLGRWAWHPQAHPINQGPSPIVGKHPEWARGGALTYAKPHLPRAKANPVIGMVESIIHPFQKDRPLMAIVLTVAMVSSSKSWFLCACTFVPGANLAASTTLISLKGFFM